MCCFIVVEFISHSVNGVNSYQFLTRENFRLTLVKLFYNCGLLTGTSADIMKVGGYKLSALEIEAVLLEAS